jgi:hypothetical protein
MPRLSLYRPEKGSDYRFVDRTVYEMFQVGGVDVFVHKYIGPMDPSDPNKALGEATIQDVIFLENRDRKYATDIYTLRGVYNVQDIDFNLSQFGLFLQNDTLFVTVHINNTVDILGRKIISGDVIELPNLKDEYALNNYKSALRRFYVVEDVNRAAEGFSNLWYPHLYRLKLKPIMDSQEYKDILNKPEDLDTFAGDWDDARTYYPGEVVRHNGDLYVVKDTVGSEGTELTPPNPDAWSPYTENTLQDILSTYEIEMQINDAIIAEAESDAALSGHDTSHFYTLAVDPLTGRPAVNTADITENIATGLDISDVSKPPVRDGYKGYLLEDGIAPNGPLSGTSSQFGFGIQFPRAPVTGDTFLRTDYLPNRLFRWDGSRWVKQEDNVRMTLTNTDQRQTLKTSFINNDQKSGISRIASDVVRVDPLGSAEFSPDDSTVDFQITTTGLYILTAIDYRDDLFVEVWLGEGSRATDIKNINASGKLAFEIRHQVQPDTEVRWSVFDQVVEQRQSVSKALKNRRIKPQADE